MVDLIIVTVIAGAVAGIVWKKIKDNKEGKGGCSCGNCGGCSSKGMCHKGSTSTRRMGAENFPNFP